MKINITFEGLTREEADFLLNASAGMSSGVTALATGVVAGAGGAGGTKPTVNTANIARLAASNPAKKPAAAKKAAAAEDDEELLPVAPKKTAASKKAAPPPEPEEDDEEEDDEEEEPAPPPKKTAVAKKGAKPAPEPEEEDEEEGDDDELDEALTGAKKLRDVLAYMMENGINDPADLKAECARLKDQVPVLSRISDLDSRIDRTLEVMDMGDAS